SCRHGRSERRWKAGGVRGRYRRARGSWTDLLDAVDAIDEGGVLPRLQGFEWRHRHAIEHDAPQVAVRVATAHAGDVVDDVGRATVLPDHHHHVSRDIDQVAGLQRAEDGQSRVAVVRLVEADRVEDRADPLRTGVARQLHAEGAV